MDYLSKSAILKEISSSYRDLANTKWKDPDAINDWMLKNEFNLIGTGSFARVYRKNKSRKVIKASKSADAVWLGYARWVLDACNIYSPKIDWLLTFPFEEGHKLHEPGEMPSDKNKFFVTSMEKLVPIKSNHIDLINDSVVAQLLYSRTDLYRKYRNLYPLMRKLINGPDEEESSNRRELISEEVMAIEYNHPLVKLFEFLDGLQRDNAKSSLDLHEYNIMWRPSTNTPVITDPLSDFS